ncbi:MAG: tetratricopeptide repeat protein [Vicinamibacterales bacterium]|nr:tetratricopeptide repeat protein [Vicinamibacterales bacterium]
MKRTERHHLKANEVAHWVLGLKDQYEANRTAINYGLLALLVLAVGVFGTMAWRSMSANRSAAMLAEAMTVAEAPVTAPVAGETGQLPIQPAGTYPSDRARFEAALPKFLAVADAHPTAPAGLVARYRAAAALVALGRADDGIQQYRQVVERGSGVIAAMAKLGVADAQLAGGKYDDAVIGLKALADAPGDDVPADGVLMQLGRAYRMAGKAADAKKLFQRVVDEFPTSVYATDAKRELETL